MDLAEVHEALVHAHQELLDEPAAGAEGLDAASCPPHVKHVAQLAMGAAAEGLTAQRWRDEIVDGLGDDVKPLLQRAETCMRDVGLWPWHDERGREEEQHDHQEGDGR